MKNATPIRMAALVALMALPLMAQSGDMRKSDDMKQMNTRPSVLEKVGIEQRLGQLLPLEAKFRDESGQEVTLGQFFNQKRPVLLALVYYDCTMLCNQVLNGMTSALGVLKFNAGQEFDVVVISFDPRETPQIASESKKTYLGRYKRPGAEQGWHFLTGEPAAIGEVTKAVGFHYVWDDKTNQFAHGSAIMLVTPEGKLAQYYYGIEYSPKDMRLGMIEASKEKIGNPVDQLVLYCFHYDPTTGKYGAIAMSLVRLGGVLTVLVLGSFMAISFRRDARNSRTKTTG